MREIPADLHTLQALLDRSHSGAGQHLRTIFDDDHRVSAQELAAALDGIIEIHLAIVAGDGSPLVAPNDAGFFRGRVWFSLAAAQTPLEDNRKGLLELRNIAAARMTPAAVAQARRRVAAWRPVHAS